jgi:hypothetical protein
LPDAEAFAAAPRRDPSIADRKARLRVFRLFDFIDHGDRVILVGNAAVAFVVLEQLIAAETEFSGGDDCGRREADRIETTFWVAPVKATFAIFRFSADGLLRWRRKIKGARDRRAPDLNRALSY